MTRWVAIGRGRKWESPENGLSLQNHGVNQVFLQNLCNLYMQSRNNVIFLTFFMKWGLLKWENLLKSWKLSPSLIPAPKYFADTCKLNRRQIAWSELQFAGFISYRPLMAFCIFFTMVMTALLHTLPVQCTKLLFLK